MFLFSLLRNRFVLSTILCIFAFSNTHTFILNAQTISGGRLDNSLNPIINISSGNVTSSAIQTDGKLLVGGSFKTINGIPRKGIVRLNTDGSIDPAFSVNIDDEVLAIAVQNDGKILIGGDFMVVDGVDRYRIARLNTDGSVDNSFTVGLNGANRLVREIKIQNDGKIVIAGDFDFLVTPAFHLKRLNSDGSNDPTFFSRIPPVSRAVPQGFVNSIALLSNGKMLIGGTFFLDDGQPFKETSILQINSDGAIDTSFFRGEINGSINDIKIQTDGKIIIGGEFVQVYGENRSNIARLNIDGTLDNSFIPQFGVPINDMHLQSDGKILFGGLILSSISFATRLNSDGSLDMAFSPDSAVSGKINTILKMPDGKIFIGGSFASFPSFSNANNAFLFNDDGSTVTTFNITSVAHATVRAVVSQNDEKIIIGGNFNQINGIRKEGLTRLNSDGTIDTTFNDASFSASEVTAVILQSDNKILVGGSLIRAGVDNFEIIRLNSDGTLDKSFNQTGFLGRSIKAMALQADGKIVVSYATQLGDPIPDGGVTRINADGSPDKSFSGSNFGMESIAIQADGKILFGGIFAFPNGDGSYGFSITRSNTDGTGDPTFRSGFDSDLDFSRFTKIYSIIPQDDGRILVGGELYVEGEPQKLGVVRLNSSGTVDGTFQLNPISSTSEFAQVEDMELLSNGDILVGGRFNTYGSLERGNVALIRNNGFINNSFVANTDRRVLDAEVQTNDNLLIGGDFENVNGIARTAIARMFNTTVNQATPFDFDGDSKTDLSIFRPSLGEWWYSRSSDGGNNAFQFGNNSDTLVPADFTGDGRTDIAFWRESTGEWFILRSEDSSFFSFPFGTAGDIPVPGDYDGDGIADVAVFRPTNATWFINRSGDGGTTITTFGIPEDKPVVADYDGDGKDDIAIYRPSVSEWWINRSNDGVVVYQFGASGDKTVQGDYTGDGKADVAFWRESNGFWFILRSEDDSFFSFPFGTNGDFPIPGDYDGDGRTDVAVFRPDVNNWFINGLTSGTQILSFGIAGDIPIPGVYTVE